MALTKADMAESLFDELGLNKREARELVDLFFEDLCNVRDHVCLRWPGQHTKALLGDTARPHLCVLDRMRLRVTRGGCRPLGNEPRASTTTSAW